jgi:adenylosuccinate lyase
MIENVLASRYITPEIKNIFDEHNRNVLERRLWISVMKSQRELGMDIPAEDISKFENAIDNIDLNAIREIERVRRHDIKAKIEHFVNVSGAGEYLHRGMTSRDLSDNVEQIQIKNASRIILGRYVSVLRHMIDKSHEYRYMVLTARTHHQPAQPTLLGRRFSMWAEELIFHLKNFENFILNYPLRGIKGPVGTQSDMLFLLKSQTKVDILENRIAEEFGFREILDSTGQVYPRSLDFSLASNLVLLGAAPENFANGMRLMSGYELVTEGFKDGQVGSSAMPHKMNTRSSERICGFAKLLKMYTDGVSRLSGDQWEEGDVSCSVLRRVTIPELFYASDGLCETTLTVLNEMGVYPSVIDKELRKYIPFLATTQILNLATQRGIGREEAHKIIKSAAVHAALEMRMGRESNFVDELSTNELFTENEISKEQIYSILDDNERYLGNASLQINKTSEKGRRIIKRHEEESKYEPQSIL